MSNSAAWMALIISAILCVFCSSFIWRQQRLLAAMQTKLDGLSQTVSSLEGAHHALLVRFLNLRRPRKAQKSSSLSLDALEEKMASSIVPAQLDD